MGAEITATSYAGRSQDRELMSNDRAKDGANSNRSQTIAEVYAAADAQAKFVGRCSGLHARVIDEAFEGADSG